MQLMGSICAIAVKLCEYGFFTPSDDENDAVAADLQALVGVILDSLLHGALLKKGLEVCPQKAVEVQLLLLKLLEFAFDVRVNVRRKTLILTYEVRGSHMTCG